MIPAVVPAGELRALTLHDVVPAGHIAVPVLHDRWSPHIRAGEFAMLDPSDTEPQLGELYGLDISDGRRPGGWVLKLVQPYRSALCGPDGVTYRFGVPQPGRLALGDGPLSRAGWRDRCRGRVVGLLSIARHEGSHG